MIKKILLILACISNNCLIVCGTLQPGHWEAIATDIARDGDDADRGEFEAARQAFLNIKLPVNAQRAAKKIEDKWKNNPEFGSEAKTEALLALPRYPNMDAKQIHNAAVDLIEKPNIKGFLASEGFEFKTIPSKL